MNLLLDSHVLIWALQDPDRLGPRTKQLMAEAESIKVSVATLWELSIKYQKGKLAYGFKDLTEGVLQLGADLLPIEARHIENCSTISMPHKDPFDILLVAQAEQEGYLFITEDAEIINTAYHVQNSAG